MGITRDGLEEHEGYTAGFVRLSSGLLRELERYGREVHVSMIAAACTCGWRSPRWQPVYGTTWYPHMVELQPYDQELRDALWGEHADHMLGLKRYGQPAHGLRLWTIVNEPKLKR
jgi:hypothetical protein